MGEIFKFFKNAVKAIFFSPFYILIFVLFLIYTIVGYVLGEIRSFIGLFTGNGYSHIEDNDYHQILMACKKNGVSYDMLKKSKPQSEVEL